MALTDDPTFLLPFIRRSYIIGDNTAFCERVLVTENVSADEILAMMHESYCMSRVDETSWQSPDIHVPQRRFGRNLAENSELRSSASSTEGLVKAVNKASNGVELRKMVNAHRATEAEKGDKKEPVEENQRKKAVLNMEAAANLDSVTIAELFSKRDTSQPELSKRQSVCTSQLLEAKRRSEANPFAEFGRFDARGRPNARTYEIFYTFASRESNSRSRVRSSQKVAVASDTLVRQTVGYALMCYVQSKQEPKLNCSDAQQFVDSFELYIADDDGSAELDLPRLEPLDQIGKYDFVRLALVRSSVQSGPLRRRRVDSSETREDVFDAADIVGEQVSRLRDSQLRSHLRVSFSWLIARRATLKKT